MTCTLNQRADGYVASDLFFFGINTAVRLGVAAAPGLNLTNPLTGVALTEAGAASAGTLLPGQGPPYIPSLMFTFSRDLVLSLLYSLSPPPSLSRVGSNSILSPILWLPRAPVATARSYATPQSTMHTAIYTKRYQRHGPWGNIRGLMVDQAVIGIHMVWPNPLSNRFSDCQLHPSFWTGRVFHPPGGSSNGGGGMGFGTGNLTRVGYEAAVLVEPTHTVLNNAKLQSTTMFSNMVVASFTDAVRKA